MARVSPRNFMDRLQGGKPIAAILLLGNEPYLRDSCRKEIIEKYVPEGSRTWAVSRYSADRGETQSALEQAQTLPMLSPQQVVFLEEAEVIEKLGEKNREEAVANLEAYLDNPAPFTVFVLEASSLDQRMKLAKLLTEKMMVVEVGLGEDPQEKQAAAAALALAIAGEEGVRFEKGAAEDLAEFVAADLQRLKTEVQKLATYVGQRKLVRREDVSAMVISEKTTTVWELSDLIATNQSAKSMEFLERLVRAGEEPIRLLGGIIFMYRKLIEASDVKGAAAGWQAAKALGMRPAQAEWAIENARRISKPRLLAGLQAFRMADSQLKGSGADDRTILEFLVAALTAPRSRSATR